ncbi:uncharacterized protein [Parasteatoda tepidariorum]|uniref:uncharacterized protein n=1 Tax=Parasteatoda tepidariorum TaxID=114398 RepID=UPI00077FB96A|nr:extensin [Parasteatoda tepidariorum]
MRSYMTDHRTPLAWRHRDMTLPNGPRNGHHHHHHHRSPPSPSVTTTSSDEREEVPMVRGPPLRRPNSRTTARYHRDGQSQFSAVEPYPGVVGPPFRNGGTLRSTRSVPAIALATWDGEPCPVHGHGLPLFHHQHHPIGHSNSGTMRRHGSLFDVRLPYYGHHPPPFPPALQYPPPPPSHLEKKSFHGSMQVFPNPYLMPPMMRPRPFVIPAGAEPLPVRDPFKLRTPPASGYAGSKADDVYSVDQICCKGHLIVLWIILAVVTIGVILGIVLGVTIA